MLNTLIWVSYDGTNYSGFQIQENAPTVQEELEKALGVIYKEPVRIAGAGRTDSGVHALGQAASFNAPFTIEPVSLPKALNTLLPPDIVVTGAEEVSIDFHARFACRGKIYSYTLDRASHPRVMDRLYSLHMPDQMDIAMMGRAAKLFMGEHDFKAFQASGSGVSDTVRRLKRVEIINLQEEEKLIVYFEGDGFLYRMVRLIMGTLIRAAEGKLSLVEIEKALSGNNPAAVGPTAPAHGLCLEKVLY